MLEEIHEFLGICALAMVIATVVVGGAAYRYQLFKSFLRLKRETLVSFHWWGSLAFVILVVLHYVTTDKTKSLLYIGVLAFAAVFLMGLSFRLSRRLFQSVIKAKVFMVMVAAIALLLGHKMLEGEEEGWEEHRGEESRYENVVPPRGKTQTAWSGEQASKKVLLSSRL